MVTRESLEVRLVLKGWEKRGLGVPSCLKLEYQRPGATESLGSICGERRACSVNYGKRSAIYIHLQQTLIYCTACLQAPSILGCSIDISGCSTIVSHINHPAEPLETILIGLWWW